MGFLVIMMVAGPEGYWHSVPRTEGRQISQCRDDSAQIKTCPVTCTAVCVLTDIHIGGKNLLRISELETYSSLDTKTRNFFFFFYTDSFPGMQLLLKKKKKKKVLCLIYEQSCQKFSPFWKILSLLSWLLVNTSE